VLEISVRLAHAQHWAVVRPIDALFDVGIAPSARKRFVEWGAIQGQVNSLAFTTPLPG